MVQVCLRHWYSLVWYSNWYSLSDECVSTKLRVTEGLVCFLMCSFCLKINSYIKEPYHAPYLYHNPLKPAIKNELTFFTSHSDPTWLASTWPCHVITRCTILAFANLCAVEAKCSTNASCGRRIRVNLKVLFKKSHINKKTRQTLQVLVKAKLKISDFPHNVHEIPMH